MPICKKCNQSFPSSIKINDKLHNLSKRSYCLNCSPFKSKNKRSLCNFNDEQDTKKCSVCKKFVPKSEFYVKKHGVLFSYCVLCEKVRKAIKQQYFKQQCVDYKGGACSICGYDKCISALEFHHLDPSKKDFGISNNIRTFNNKVKQELDKCIMVCSNCHKELHHTTV